MVWSQKDAAGVNVYYSPDGEGIVQITSTGKNILPNLHSTENSTWLIWVDKSKPEANILKYALLSVHGIPLEVGTLPTTSGDIYTSAIAADPSGQRVWAVWVEYNGHRENLYASFLDINNTRSASWQSPLQITPDSAYSANLPVIDEALLDRIKLRWMRTSPKSSESASVEITAYDWAAPQTAQESNGTASIRQAPPSLLTLKKGQTSGAFVKRLEKDQPLSPDEQKWKKLVHDKKVLTGAIHSGSGPSERLADEVK